MTSERLIAGRYRLSDPIGSGAMGVVWKATDVRLQRTVAVKQLRLDPGLTPAQIVETRARAMREGRIAARLHHPNAITVFDVAEEDGRPWLVMEFMDAPSLAARISGGRTLPPMEVARIGAQAAAALAAAHTAGILHRDVKPGNLLVGDDGTVKITDFGISRAVGDVTVTATGFLAGTPAYLAPEVARGENGEPASDVFALGSTLYAAVTGSPPFGEGDNPLAVLHAVARGHVQPPQHAGALGPVLMHLLASTPEARPTMREAAEALEGVAVGRPAGPAPGPPPGGYPRTAVLAGPGGTTVLPDPGRFGGPPPVDPRSVPPGPPANAFRPAYGPGSGPSSPGFAAARGPVGSPGEGSGSGPVSPGSVSSPDAGSGSGPASRGSVSSPGEGFGSGQVSRGPVSSPGAEPGSGPAAPVSAAAADAGGDAVGSPAAAGGDRSDPADDSGAGAPRTGKRVDLVKTPAGARSAAAVEPNSDADTPAEPASSDSTPNAVTTALPASSGTPGEYTPDYAAFAAAARPAPATPTPAPAPLQYTPATPRSDPAAGKRLQLAALGAIALAVIVLAGVLIGLVVRGTGDDDQQAAPPSSPSSSLDAAVPPPATPEPAPAPATSNAPAPQNGPPTPEQQAQFVQGYYGMLPGDIGGAWAQLSPGYQAQTGGFGAYSQFWSTIRGVRVGSITPSGPDTVVASLTYTMAGGGTSSESRWFRVANEGGRFVIAGSGL